MTDEMSLLLEAFAAEAGERVAQLRREVGRLQQAPGDGAGWRAAAAGLRLIADSAVMMELPAVERLSRHGQTACEAMAEQADWQRSEVVAPLVALVEALARLLAGLPAQDFDQAAVLAEGRAAYAAWEQQTRAGAGGMGDQTAPAAPAVAPAVPVGAPPERAVAPAAPAAAPPIEAAGAMPAWVAAGPPVAPVQPPPVAWELPASGATNPPAPPATGAPAEDEPAPASGPLARLARWRRAFNQGVAAMLPAARPDRAGARPAATAAPPEAWQQPAEPTAGAPAAASEPEGAAVDARTSASPGAAAEAPALPEAALAPGEEAALPAASAAAGEAPPAAPAIDADLLAVFSEEVGEHLAALDGYLTALRERPDDQATLAEIRRSLHTLKGAAGMVGLTPVHGLGRAAEQTVEGFLDTGAPAPAGLGALVEETVALLRAAAAAGFAPASLAACATHTARWQALPAPAPAPAAAPLPADEAAAATAPARAEPVAGERATPGAGRALSPAERAPGAPDGPARAGDGAPGAGQDEAQVAALFAEEVREGLRALHELLARLTEPAGDGAAAAERDGERRATVLELQRQAHTLKGAAAMMGRHDAATLLHRMEDVLARLADGALPITPALVGLLFDTVETLEMLAGAAGAAGAEPARVLATRYTAVLGAAEAVQRGAAPPPAAPPIVPSAAPGVRIDLDDLNHLMGLTEELVMQRAAFQDRLAGLAGLLRDFERSVERLARVSRVLEHDYEAWGVAGEQRPVDQDDFDTLEFDRYTEFRRLTGELVEAVADARTVSRDVGTALTGMTALVGRQGRVASALRKGLETVSLVALSGLIPLARRVASQTALGEGKRVAVETVGLELLVDRSAYDVVAMALGHIVRNAVVHGIEPAEARRAAGKDEIGRLTIEARQESYETIVAVRDDGAGIDRARVRRQAEALGWLDAGAEVSDAELLGLIFRPGFSTAEEVDEAAGRGVGLDAVLAAVTAVRGRLTVESIPGQGTCFTLRLPLMMTVAELLLVDSGGRRLALPLHWLQGTLRIDAARLRPGPDGPEAPVGEEWLPVVPLAEVLGWPADLAARAGWPAVIAVAGGRRVVVVVDRLVQRQELAVASLGPSFAWLRSLLGACLLGDGRVVPVLDLPALLEQGRTAAPLAAPAAPRPPRVLVVDDSLSVRRVVALALERQGWEVVQARHGQEALALLATMTVDAMLLDVEMPQMDGYALLERLRGSAEHARLPVAMLTSRAADKHRQRAFDLGANAYLVKPYDEGHLIATLRALLDEALEPAGTNGAVHSGRRLPHGRPSRPPAA
jgi:chemosensory pili system protein ChpA (sensor histidine kinase/response regulator)